MLKPIFLIVLIFASFEIVSAQNERIIKSGIINGKATYLPKPEYTEEAKNFCASGIVEVEVKSHAVKGEVLSAKAISGNELLRESAEKAAMQARFSASNINGDRDFYVIGILVYNFVPERKCIELGVVNKKAKYLPKPIYPKSCRCQGIIKVRIVIDIINGDVISARTEAGNPLLGVSAVEAARKTKFSPTPINSSPIFVVAFLEYKFYPNGKVST